MADPSLLQIVGGGVAGGLLTYALTWWRERRRMKDAYRAPQREAVAGIMTAVHELLVSESDHREAAETLVREPDQISDADLDAIINAFARAVYGVEAAFNVGKVTIVDSVCREYMGRAYNTFILHVHSLRSALGEILPDNAIDRMPDFIERYQAAVQQLNVAVTNLVEASQERISPTQSWPNQLRRRGVKKRLQQDAAAMQQKLAGLAGAD